MNASLLYAFTAVFAQTTNRWIMVDIVDSLRRSDLVGYLCLITLAFFSVLSWAVIVFKMLHVRSAHVQSQRYVDLCAESGRLEDAFRHAAAFPDCPLAQIAKETYLEVQTEDWFRSAASVGVSHRLEVAKITLERVHDRTITREIRSLESWLIFLATTASVCPFLGLFGTVWGILGVFQALGAYSSADLQHIAPGIATALTTTVAGLLAAIPAVVSYNYLTNSIQLLISRMDAFALELSAVIQRQILAE